MLSPGEGYCTRWARGDGGLSRELCKYSLHDEGYLCSRRRRIGSDRTEHEQLFNIAQRPDVGVREDVQGRSSECYRLQHLLTFGFQFEDNEVGFVTGRITTSSSSNVPVLEPTHQASLSASHPASAPGPAGVLGARPTQRLPHSTMIGELKLTVLKARLAAVGVQAELIGEGVLVCQGGDVETVAVRKSARGQVELEGTVCEVYYKVRKEIYRLHALVSS